MRIQDTGEHNTIKDAINILKNKYKKNTHTDNTRRWLWRNAECQASSFSAGCGAWPGHERWQRRRNDWPVSWRLCPAPQPQHEHSPLRCRWWMPLKKNENICRTQGYGSGSLVKGKLKKAKENTYTCSLSSGLTSTGSWRRESTCQPNQFRLELV